MRGQRDRLVREGGAVGSRHGSCVLLLAPRVMHVGTTGLWAYLIHPRGWVPLWKWAPAMMTVGVLLLQARGADGEREGHVDGVTALWAYPTGGPWARRVPDLPLKRWVVQKLLEVTGPAVAVN